MSETDSDSSSDTAPRPQTPGPADPHKCAVTGAGFSGGAAGEIVSLTIVSKDGRGVRVREGDCEVMVVVKASEPGALSVSEEAGEGPAQVEVRARDNGDGTYSASYSVPSRGNYTLSITMNGTPIGGSPFPVFFSPPQPGAASTDMGGSAPNVDGASVAGSLGSRVANLTDGLTVAEATQALGGAIVNAVYVTSISPNVQLEQLKQLFAYCGKVANVHFIGETRETALVEYTTALEARCATGLDGTVVGDRSLRVQLGIDLASASTSGGNPYLSLQQVQQLQHVHSSNQHATQLAAQLAGLRAIARTALLPAIQDEEKKNSGRKAALAAAAELTRKLYGVGSAPKGSSPPSFASKQNQESGRSRRRRRSNSRVRPHKPSRRHRSRTRSHSRSSHRELNGHRDDGRKQRSERHSHRPDVSYSRSRSRGRESNRDRRRKESKRSSGIRSSRGRRSMSPAEKRLYSPRRSDHHKKARVLDRSRHDSPGRSNRHVHGHSRSRSKERGRERRHYRKDRDYERAEKCNGVECDKSNGNGHRKHSRKVLDSKTSPMASPKQNEYPAVTESGKESALEENGNVLEEMRQRALQAFLEKTKSSDAADSICQVIEPQMDVSGSSKGDTKGGDEEVDKCGVSIATGIAEEQDEISIQQASKEGERKKGHRENRRYRKSKRRDETPPRSERRSKRSSRQG